MIIDCISDTHGEYPELEGGDLLIIAGDLTGSDKIIQYESFVNWTMPLNYEKIIVIAGNHDNVLQAEGAQLFKGNPKITYLCDSGIEFCGTTFDGKSRTTKIYGSPWTKTFPGINPHCKAFTCDTEEELAEKWALIPDDTDILITHGPSIGVLDETVKNKFVGSVSLSAQIGFLQNLKVHIFGHIHEAYGKIDPPAYLPNYFDVCKHYSINACIMNKDYDPVNKPIRVEL